MCSTIPHWRIEATDGRNPSPKWRIMLRHRAHLPVPHTKFHAIESFNIQVYFLKTLKLCQVCIRAPELCRNLITHEDDVPYCRRLLTIYRFLERSDIFNDSHILSFLLFHQPISSLYPHSRLAGLSKGLEAPRMRGASPRSSQKKF